MKTRTYGLLLIILPLFLFNLSSEPIKKAGISNWLKENGIPVLCYHHLSQSNGSSNPYIISAEQFNEQIQWLKQEGYQTINLNKFDKYLNGDLDNLPEKPILITFDDASKNAVLVGSKILDKAGYKGIYFIFKEGKGNKFASQAEISSLLQRGHDIQNHTITHRSLGELDEFNQSLEINNNASYINKKFNKRSRWLAFPFSSYSNKTLKLLRRKKYKGAFTMFPGSIFPGHSRYVLPRYMVLNYHKLADFKKKLRLKAIPVLKSFPVDGDYLRINQRVRFKIKPGFDKNMMLVTLGDNFIGKNKPIKFKYDQASGEIAFRAKLQNERNIFISIYIFKGDEIYQANLTFYPLWLKSKSKATRF